MIKLSPWRGGERGFRCEAHAIVNDVLTRATRFRVAFVATQRHRQRHRVVIMPSSPIFRTRVGV